MPLLGERQDLVLVATFRQIHALRDWLGRVVLFEDVDATTIIEVKVQGRQFALAHVVRRTNQRGVREITDELRAVQAAGLGSLPPGLRAGSRFLLSVPGFVRRLVYRALLRFPQFAKRHTGTMLVTSVGMSSGGGWG